MMLYTHIKDFESGNIEDTNEVVPGFLGVEGLVDAPHQPAEHPVVQTLSQGADGVRHLLHVPTLGHELCADLNLGLQQALEQVSSIDAEEEGHLLCLCNII